MTEDVRDQVAGEGPGATTPGDSLSEPSAEESAAAPEVEAFAAGTAAGEALPAAPPVDYKDRWLRAEAELQNFRRRAQRDRGESVLRAEDAVLLDVLTVLDDFERALAAMSPAQAAEPWAQGVALTAQRLRDTLGRYGVAAVASVGRPFDPALHEALAEIEAPEGVAPGAVAQEIAKGYRRGERVLRAARVVVARARAEG